MFNFYIAHEFWFAAAQLVLAMLGMGATLTINDFAEIAREPKAFSVGAALQIVAVPLVAFLFLLLLDLSPLAAGVGLVVGLALCAAIPGGTVSNIFTHLAYGNVPLSIAITAVTTLACLLTTPLVLDLLIAQHMPPDFRMPIVRIAKDIFFWLLLPLALGMLYLRLWPTSAAQFSTGCIRASLFVIVLIVLGSLGAGRIDFVAFGSLNVLLVLLFVGVLTGLGLLVPRLASLQRADCTAIGIEIAVRNTNLALLIKASLFPAVVGVADPLADSVLFTILLYGGVMLLIGAYRVHRGRLTSQLQFVASKHDVE